MSDITISWITGKPIEESSRRYPCRFCRRNPVAPGYSVICAQCLEDLNTSAVPSEEIGHCPTGITAKAECRKCFEDPETLRLSRTGGWQGHCGYWQRTRRLDGTADPEGIFEDSLRHQSTELKQSARYQRRCLTRLGIEARHINDDVYDLLITAGGEPRVLRHPQRAALRQLAKGQERLTRADVIRALT